MTTLAGYHHPALQEEENGGDLVRVPATGWIQGTTTGVAGEFPGIAQTSFNPPDDNLAVSPTEVVEAVNETLGFYHKDGTFNSPNTLTLTALFPHFAPDLGVFDPRIVFDPANGGHFILVGLERGSSPQASFVDIAVSATASPIADPSSWFTYRVNSLFNSGGTNYWVDFPGLGFDATAVYFTGNLFSFGNQFLAAQLMTFDKTALENGTAGSPPATTGDPRSLTPVNSQQINDGGSIQPAVTVGTAPAEYMIEDWASSPTDSTSTLVRVHAVTNPLAPGGFTRTTSLVTVPSYGLIVPGAPQQGSTNLIATNDTRIINALWVNGSLWAGHSIQNTSAGQNKATARWYQVSTGTWPTSGSPALAQSGNIDPGTGIATFFPSVAADAAGNAVIGYAESSAQMFPSAEYTIHPATSAESTGVIQTGLSAYAGSRWGDYSGTVSDPTTPGLFWTVGMATQANGSWGTWWNSVSVPTTTLPAIVDDLDPSFSLTGTWSTWTGGGYGGDLRFKINGDGTSTASWQISGLAAGDYNVQSTWNPFSNHASNAPYRVYDGSTLLATFRVDQRVAPSGTTVGGVAFQTLGTVHINSGTLKVVLGDDADGYVIADAVRVLVPPPPPPTLPAIVDDVDPGFSLIGTWSTSTGIGYGGDVRFKINGDGTSTAAWQLASMPVGDYTVQATWNADATHATNAPYRVYDGSTLVTTFLVNQQVAPTGTTVGGVAFQNLGTVHIASGTMKVVLGDDANGYVVADAVRIIVPPPPPPTLPEVIDDLDPSFTVVGPWDTWTGGGYAGDLRFKSNGTGNSTATWQTVGLPVGDYVVQSTWNPYSNHASNAPYRVYDGSTLVATFLVDQRAAPSGTAVGGVAFQSLGTVHITSGTLKVVLGDDANGYVIADAVRIILPPPPPPTLPAIVDDLDAGFSLTGTWSTSTGVGYGGDLRFKASGDGTSTATWRLVSMPAGDYAVQATWNADATHATNAPYRVYDGSTLVATFLVNQQVAPTGTTVGGVAFQNLGTVHIASGTMNVVLGDDANGTVVADAVRIIVPPPTLPEVVDDLDPNFSVLGAWDTWTGGGYGGDLRFKVNGSGTSTAAWQTTGLPVGDYLVQSTWNPWSNHATNAPYRVYDGSTLVATFLVNQQASPTGTTVGGVVFQDLGTVHIASGTLKVVLGDDANGYVIADAVRILVPPPPPPPPPPPTFPAIVDDLDSSFKLIGSWDIWTGGGYAGDLRFKLNGDGTSTAAWQLVSVPVGDYVIQSTWNPFSNHATNAPYRVYDGSTLVATFLANQQVAPTGTTVGGVAFQTLGTVHIASGTLIVVLGDDANGYVIADAVRIILPGTAAPIVIG